MTSRRVIAGASILAISGATFALAQALPTIVEGAGPIAVHVAAMPTAPLTIDAAGEYQIDATSGSRDAQLLLLQGDVVAAEDSTSLGSDARIVTFLEAGVYGVLVRDSLGRGMTARLSATLLAPLPSAATIRPGDEPVTVQVPQGGSVREGSGEVTLHVEAPGTYRIDARSPDADHDAELQLIRDGALLQADADGGDGTDAQIVRALEPGDYRVRVHDYANRSGALVVQVVPE